MKYNTFCFLFCLINGFIMLILPGCKHVDKPPFAAPVFKPAAGTYDTAQGVILLTDQRATGTYWTDGNGEPKKPYSVGDLIPVDGAHGTSVTIKAFSEDLKNKQRSEVVTAVYHFQKRDNESFTKGKTIAGMIADKQPEEAVIMMKNFSETCNMDDCKSGFLAAGGEEKVWDLLIAACNSPEFDTGADYGNKLQKEKLLDADIVEYMKNSLKNAPGANKLAFSAGFISVFKDDRSTARHHMDSLWLWTMPGE